MRFLQIPSLFGLAALFVLLLAACGGSTSSTGSTGSTGSTTNSSYASNSSSSTPAASQAAPTPGPAKTTAAGAVTVKTMTAMVNGKSMTVLANAQGITLYYFKPDTKSSSACTGACANNWPPLVTTGSSAPVSATTLPGKLTVQKSANGMQIQYNGHFLYAFAGDQAPGDTKGEGLASGKWFVATPDLAELQ